MNATEIDQRIREGFADLLAQLRGGPDEPERSKERAATAARAIARNDADIEREWHSLGVEPIRGPNGRPVSLYLARKMGLVQIVSEAAE